MPENVDHLTVVGIGDGPETRHSRSRREQSQPLKKKASDAFTVEFVLDGHCDLGALLVAAEVRSHSQNDLFVSWPPRHQQSEQLPMVRRIAQRTQEFRGRFRERKKAPLAGFGREPMKEVRNCAGIVARRDPYRRRRAVAQNKPPVFGRVLVRSGDV